MSKMSDMTEYHASAYRLPSGFEHCSKLKPVAEAATALDRVKAVVEVCKDKHIPIRIGVNGGSLDKRLLEKYGHPTAEALVESAFEHLELLEKQGFYDTCVSMKSSSMVTSLFWPTPRLKP